MAIKTQPYTVEHVDSVVGGLHGLKAEFENRHLTELFAEDPQRFEKFSVTLEPVVFDFLLKKLTIPNSVQPCIGRYGYLKMISLILN